MFKNKVKSIGNIKDSNGRKYVAIKKNGDLIVKILASEDDKYNINNYSSNCVTDIHNKTNNSNELMNTNFNSYVRYVSEGFDKGNYDLNRFISRFVYACRIEKLILNNYNKFIKNNVMFGYYLMVDEIYENDKLYKFKSNN